MCILISLKYDTTIIKKMMTHHSVMTSSLSINILKTDKYFDFSSDIDFNSKTDIFRDVSSLIINHCDPRRPKGVSASRAAQASEAGLYILYRKDVKICFTIFCRGLDMPIFISLRFSNSSFNLANNNQKILAF